MPSSTPASGTGSREASLEPAAGTAPVGLDLRRLPHTRAWYTEVWIQLLRRKPLGTSGAIIVVAMLGVFGLHYLGVL
ncbi:MAG: hypothetical protein AAB328_06195, partial [candidate division NC10 bacterium]